MAVQKKIKIVENPGSVINWQVDDRTTTSQTAQMNEGEPVKEYADGSPYVFPVATGDPEQGTDVLVGITNEASSETSTANGDVDVKTIKAMETVLRGKATTAANVDTDAEILALIGDWVTFDVTSLTGTNGDFTIDEDEGNDSDVHGLKILRGDAVRNELDVFVHFRAMVNYN